MPCVQKMVFWGHFHPQGGHFHPQETSEKARLLYGSEILVDGSEFGIIHQNPSPPTCKKLESRVLAAVLMKTILNTAVQSLVIKKMVVPGTSIHQEISSIHQKRKPGQGWTFEWHYKFRHVHVFVSNVHMYLSVHIIMIYFVLMICYGMIYSLVMCIVLSVKLYSLVINFSCAWLRVCYVEVKV